MSSFSKFSWKTPCCHAYIWSKNINSVKALLHFWVNRMPIFLLIFHVKLTALMPLFCQKNVYSLKNTMLSFPYLVEKRPFSQKHRALMCFFFSKFSWKTSAVVHMIGQKTSILSKLHSILGQKSHRMPFFPIYHEKISALMSIFCQKNVHSQKRNSSHLHVLSKKRPLS